MRRALRKSSPFRSFRVQRQSTKDLFRYERTSPIIGRRRWWPSCILKRTLGSSVGSDSATPDCWLWFYGARIRQIVEGARKLRRHPARPERPGASFHGMAYHLDRAHRRPRGLARSLRPLVSLPMAMLLFVAISTVHLPYGFSSIKLMNVMAGRAQFGPPGYECDLLYLACLAALVFGGSGPLAIDGLLGTRRPGSSRV